MNQNVITKPITGSSRIGDVVADYPQTIVVFNRLRMACPGCEISPFHTVSDGAREYNLNPTELLLALNNTVNHI